MFVVTLRFADESRAEQWMAGHNAWLRRGFDEGVFLVAGGLKPEGGGAIVAHGTSLEALRERVDQDPFVSEGVVRAEVIEIVAAKADPRLGFLIG